jgi:hypothetical protein
MTCCAIRGATALRTPPTQCAGRALFDEDATPCAPSVCRPVGECGPQQSVGINYWSSVICRRTPKPMKLASCRYPLFRRLNLPKSASLHSLRHSHCSHLLAGRCPTAGGVRSAVPWINTNDPGDLRSYDPRAR